MEEKNNFKRCFLMIMMIMMMFNFVRNMFFHEQNSDYNLQEERFTRSAIK